MSNGLPGIELGSNWTPLTRNVIVTLFAIYVVQLLAGGEGGPVQQLFAWYDFGAGFHPWQVATAFLLSGPSPLSAVFEWLAIFFFLAPVAGMLGNRRLAQALGVSWLVSVVVAATLVATGVVTAAYPFMGVGPLVAALVGLFGFLMPNAVIRIYFVLPIKAVWIAWGTGLIAFLFFLYARDLGTSLTFFAWGGAAAWLAVQNGALRRLSLRWKKRQIERRLSRFEVIEGGRTERRPPAPGGKRESSRDDWVH